ncbi:hypothetical protein C5167_005254 [Papaver somniferum]|uniref:Uncharacterized protein n=1 Tax=Papaver somniferum TaxID=3469 RepID=A0A4Y7JA17_PAPSO|nr:protein argonaute 1-like [Papaver somniferum]RZC57943.1 hypothetical protein C5167_005254 [Papaver somniferum]
MVRKRRTQAASDGETMKSTETAGVVGSVEKCPQEKIPPPSQGGGRGGRGQQNNSPPLQGGGRGDRGQESTSPPSQGGGRGGRDQQNTPLPSQRGGRGGRDQESTPTLSHGGGRGGRGQGGRGSSFPSQQGPFGANGGRGYGRGPGRYQSHIEVTVPQQNIVPMHGSAYQGGGNISGGLSSSVTILELHQASPAAPPELNPSAVKQQLQKLSGQSVGASITTVQSVGTFPALPDKGTAGVRCLVKANHFLAKLQMHKELYHYDVAIAPEVTSWGVNRAIMKQLVNLYRNSQLGGRLPAYDGQHSLFTAGELPFALRDFSITLPNEDDGMGISRAEKKYTVTIKLVAHPDLHHLELFLQGRQTDVPQEVITVLDVVLRQEPTAKYPAIARSFYSPTFGRRQSLGEGLEIWRGFYQSIRPTQMGLSLNVDMSSTAFIEALPVIEYVSRLLNRDIKGRPMTDSDRVKIKKALRGVKVQVTHRGNMRRKYCISGITASATCELTFPVDDKGTLRSVVQYFQETYNVALQHTSWPCLIVGNQRNPNYMPMEVCNIVEGQRYTKRLSERQITALLQVTCQSPRDRELDILQTVGQNEYDKDPYAKEFGMEIRKELASVEARILPAPLLKYHDTGRQKSCLPIVGTWNMLDKKMVNPGKVDNWVCINFSRNLQEVSVINFCKELAQMCCTHGMIYNLDPIYPPYLATRPDHPDRALKDLYNYVRTKLQPQCKELDLLIVILPDSNGSLYGDVKRICETELGLVSQCCLTKHVYKPQRKYLANVALKINVKVGGRNTVLVDALSRSIPLVSDVPTIIFGADVTHPRPGEPNAPSIAAVVASQDWPEVTKYAGLVCAQASRQEIIEEMYKETRGSDGGIIEGGMVKELLLSFYEATGRKPERIIFYRDGVSEGQFYQVLFHELHAIRMACKAMQENYQPPVTFVIVQKRHRTRLFADNNRSNAGDKNIKFGNILPGTVVDSSICHPTEFDFYLCSHKGIKGTSRPAHYHVLWDDNKFTADELQTLTNNLCYTYARCTSSVSIVPPAYYAHLAAFRARCYMMDQESSENGAVSSNAVPTSRGAGSNSRPVTSATPVPVRPLPAIMENVKKVMFYC